MTRGGYWVQSKDQSIDQEAGEWYLPATRIAQNLANHHAQPFHVWDSYGRYETFLPVVRSIAVSLYSKEVNEFEGGFRATISINGNPWPGAIVPHTWGWFPFGLDPEDFHYDCKVKIVVECGLAAQGCLEAL